MHFVKGQQSVVALGGVLWHISQPYQIIVLLSYKYFYPDSIQTLSVSGILATKRKRMKTIVNSKAFK